MVSIAGTQKTEQSAYFSRTRKAASSAIWVLPTPPRPSMAVRWQSFLLAFGGILSRSRQRIVSRPTKSSFRPNGTVQWHTRCSRFVSVWAYRSRMALDTEAAVAAAKCCHFSMRQSRSCFSREIFVNSAHLLVLMAIRIITYSFYHETWDLFPDSGTLHLKCDDAFFRDGIPVLPRLHDHIA